MDAPNNRSLVRGIDLLRCFRPGTESLGNGELAERTGLPKSTVSRLTQTLVATGFLQVDVDRRAYRLAPSVLSLAHAMRSSSSVIAMAAPLMRELAEKERLNVGLAAPDQGEMVYLESIRYNRRVALRTVVSGQRIPMELTSLGRAYLAPLSDAELAPLMAMFRKRRVRTWSAVKAQIAAAMAQTRRMGYCQASWQPEVVAVATPLAMGGAAYVLNLSVSTAEPLDEMAAKLGPTLMGLREDLLTAFRRESENL